MKAKQIFVFLMTFVLLFQSYSFANTDSYKTYDNCFETILSIDIGSNEENVSYSDDSNLLLKGGPEAFTVDSDGNIFILDTLDKKVMVFQDGQWEKNIDISFTTHATLIEQKQENLILLDASNYIYEIDRDGLIINTFELPETATSDNVRLMQSEREKIILTLYSGESIIITQIKSYFNSIEPTVTLEFDDSNGSVNIIKKMKKVANINFSDNKGGVDFLGEDSRGNFYLDVLDQVADSSTVILEETIRKYNKKGKMIGVVRVASEEFYLYPKKLIHITDDSEIYLMALKKDSVEIQRINFKNHYESNMKKLKQKAVELMAVEASNSSLKQSEVPIMFADPSFPTRVQVLTRANAMKDLGWSYKQANSTNAPTDVIKPAYLASLTFPTPTSSWTLVGIPYCWGGFDSIDRSSYPSSYPSFVGAMNIGKFAGNINCVGSFKGGTAGLDCSGFASSAYGFTTKFSTAQMATTGQPKTTPLSMDFYVKSGNHVFLFVSNASSTAINTIEASTDLPAKVKSQVRTLQYINTNGYQLRSYW